MSRLASSVYSSIAPSPAYGPQSAQQPVVAPKPSGDNAYQYAIAHGTNAQNVRATADGGIVVYKRINGVLAWHRVGDAESTVPGSGGLNQQQISEQYGLDSSLGTIIGVRDAPGIAGPAAQQPNQLPDDPFGQTGGGAVSPGVSSPSGVSRTSENKPQGSLAPPAGTIPLNVEQARQSLYGGGTSGFTGVPQFNQPQQVSQPQFGPQQVQPSSTGVDQPSFTSQQPQQLGILAKQGSTAPAGTIDFSAGTIAMQQRKYPSMGAF